MPARGVMDGWKLSDPAPNHGPVPSYASQWVTYRSSSARALDSFTSCRTELVSLRHAHFKSASSLVKVSIKQLSGDVMKDEDEREFWFGNQEQTPT